MMEFLVEHDQRRRIVRAKPKELAEACGLAFNLLGAFTLEMWSPAWDCWVTFSPEDEIPPKPRIRMVDSVQQTFILLENSVETPEDADQGDSVRRVVPPKGADKKDSVPSVVPPKGADQGDSVRSVETLVDADQGDSFRSVVPPKGADQGDSVRSFDEAERSGVSKRSLDLASCSTLSVCSTPSLPTVGLSPPDTSQSSEASGEDNIWHAVSATLSLSCRTALMGKEKLSDRHWQELMQSFTDATRESLKPPGVKEYQKWAADLVDTFGVSVRMKPSLLESINAVKSKLKNRLKNERHRHPEQDTENRAKRMRQAVAAAAVGLPNYSAARDELDSDLVEAACKLKNQADLSREETAALKDKTFPTRRVLLTKSKEPLQEIKERFPWLFNEHEIWDEFRRICGEDRREEARNVMGIIFKAMSRRFFTKDEQEILRGITDYLALPCAALADGRVAMREGNISAEGLTLCQYGSIQDGLLLWAVCHSVFALQAERRVGALLHFVQSKALAVHEATSATSKKLTEKLGSFLDSE